MVHPDFLKRILRVPTRAFLLMLALQTAGFSQGVTGSITGVITDPAKAVVPGAQITVRETQTGVVTKTQTNNAGVYNIPSLPIGTYELDVEAAGFKTYVQSNVLIEASRVVRLDVELQVGGVGEKVTVQAEAPLLETESSDIGTQVNKNLLNRLPFQLSGASRDPTSFIRLTPGATGGAFGANIAGGRAFASEVLVDGVPAAYNAATNSPDQDHPTYDSVAEFRVEAVIPPAEYGRTSSGVVTMVTRSGTNEAHGDTSLLLRNNVFDARRYNARIADITRQGEFDATIGGPVYIPKLYNGKNRTFFFGTYNGFRRINDPQGQVATVATAKMRQGDFSENPEILYDPATTDASGNRKPFPGNIIPADRISLTAQKVQSVIAPANSPGLANNYIGDAPATQNEDHFLTKIDHQISEKNKFSGSVRYQNNRRTFSRGPLAQVSDGFKDSPNSRNVVLSDDYIIRPNVINRVQVGYTRFGNPTASSQDIGVKVPGAFVSGFPQITFSGQGLTQIGYSDFRYEGDDNYDLQDSASWTKGKHNLKFGGRLDQYRFNFRPLIGNAMGSYDFSRFATSQPGAANSGNAYAGFLLGLVNSASLATGGPYGLRSNYLGLYAQDDWKITTRLTMNYGIRWEFQNPWYEVAGRLSQMDLTAPNPGAGGRPGAIVFAGSGPGRRGGNGFQPTYFGGVGPRIGLAYQLTPGTVVRAGYGIMYAPIIGNNVSLQGFNASIGISSQNGGLTPAFQIDQGWPPGVIKQPPFIDPTVANGQNTSTSFDRPGDSGRLGRTQQWQLNIQQTVKGVLLEGSYVGTVAHNIPNNALVILNQLDPKYLALGSLLTRDINDPAVRAAGFGPPFPGFTGSLAQSLRPFPQYQSITTYQTPTGNSTYHALLFKSEKRFSNGLQFLVAYTNSKTLTDIAFDANGQLAGPQNQYNRRAEKALANTDIPQRLVLTYVYELPWGKGKRYLSQGVLSQVLGGLTVSGIHTYQSGGVLRITTPNNLPIFNGHLRPNRVPGVPTLIGPGRGEFQPRNALTGQAGDLRLNRAAFAVPDPFTFGNLGVFLPDVRAFGSRTEDLSVSKRVRFLESRSFEFRVDFFNAFNRRNLSAPVTDLSNPNFGRITGQGSPRSVEMGARIDF